MEKINIAELLKDCPQGMELDYALFEDTIFIGVEEGKNYPILIKLKDGSQKRLTKYGCHSNTDYAKCVIFPKGKTTWEGFHRPFKNGDILAIGDTIYIYNGIEDNLSHGVHVIVDSIGLFAVNTFTKKYVSRFATEEEKQKLFDAIKNNGYKWNSEIKTLEKLIELKKFDITTLKPFDQVLVRDDNECVWKADFYSHYENKQQFSYACVGDDYKQCIPYNEETAHLVSTNHNCPDKYKTWR